MWCYMFNKKCSEVEHCWLAETCQECGHCSGNSCTVNDKGDRYYD